MQNQYFIMKVLCYSVWCRVSRLAGSMLSSQRNRVQVVFRVFRKCKLVRTAGDQSSAGWGRARREEEEVKKRKEVPGLRQHQQSHAVRHAGERGVRVGGSFFTGVRSSDVSRAPGRETLHLAFKCLKFNICAGIRFPAFHPDPFFSKQELFHQHLLL